MSRVRVVLPGSVRDPARPSGGNVYDRRVCRELARLDWSVVEHPVSGDWPTPSPRDLARLAQLLDRFEGREVVLLDGLLASASPEALVPHADRLRLVVLVHQLLVDGLPASDAVRERERAALRAARAVVVTSGWSRERVLRCHAVDPARLHVAEPGADQAPLARGSATGGRLLCVGVVAPHKGQDVLLAALAQLGRDMPDGKDGWDCTFVGSLEGDPPFASTVRRRAVAPGLREHVQFTGPLPGPELDARYGRSDLLVVPSRAESYGMVATEALAHGIPVLASQVGGVPEALSGARDAEPAGLLVPPGDPQALARALRWWLRDPALRERLRARARRRRLALPRWADTARALDTALLAAAGSDDGARP